MNLKMQSVIGLTITVLAITARGQETPTCDSLAASSLPKTTITSATQVEAGQLKDGIPSAIAEQLPAFCRVAIKLTPSSDSDINAEVWLPKDWNGRLQGVGNGGLAGSISYPALAAAVRDGYAAVSTDTGHTGSGMSGEWALKHPEKVIDFGHRAVHEMTVAAKAIVKTHYGKPQHHAYWNGCSEGGNQALHEAQRYPQDYDGIVAGAPANFMTHLQAGGLWISHAIHKDPATFISSAKLPAINQAVLAACDDLDGLQDGVVGDPRNCSPSFDALRCRGAESDQCLTAPQLNGLMKIYGGAKNPHTSQQIFPGYSPGSELEWGSWIAGTESPPRNRQHLIADNLFKFMVFGNAEWDWKSFDFDKDVTLADSVAAATNSINPDLSAFKKRGGKLLQYHGWYDPAISPLNSIQYFESVQKKMGDTKNFYRLFMLPGVAHCAGGPGMGEFDRMNILVRWVEEGKAPDSIIASKTASGGTQPDSTLTGETQTRLLCPHPQVARYKGKGPVSVENFSCPAIPTVTQATAPTPAPTTAPKTAPAKAPTKIATLPPTAAAKSVEAWRYQTRRDHDPDGIGKFYLDREIAQVMGPGGMLWLERPEREIEEQPDAVLAALKIQGGENVVDFGAGSGYYTFRLAKAVGPKGTVLAADIEPKMLEFIRQRAVRENLTNVGLLLTTETDPKLPSNRIDIVLMVDVYHELSFPYEVMSKVRSALRPKGRVVLIEYREEDPAVMIKPVHKMSQQQVIKEMNAVGLKHVETVGTLPLQHLMIFDKQ